MPFISHTEKERQAMLDTLGVESMEVLLQKVIPESLRVKGFLNVPPSKKEIEVFQELFSLGEANRSYAGQPIFLGAGCYHHYIPSLVDSIASRGELITAYTPYQAEASQATLRFLYEFQSYLSLLTGMAVANTGHYDGATALAEGILMACSTQGIQEVVLAGTLHPEYQEVVRTYLQSRNVSCHTLGYSRGRLDVQELQTFLLQKKKPVVLALQHPNFFGLLEDVGAVGQTIHETGGVVVMAVVEPISLGLLKPPAEEGVDVAVGEAQGFGLEPNFGGPHLGFMTAREEYLRKMPGRIAGKTMDQKGRSAYTLILQTREQHIRREKATSNICTNQTLMAIRTTLYLASVGGEGLSEVARQSFERAHELAEKIVRHPKVQLVWPDQPFFNEFAVQVETKGSIEDINRALSKAGILGGLPLKRFYPDALEKGWLLCATELTRSSDVDRLVDLLFHTL